MKISGVRKIRIAITISLLLLFLFANIYAIRQLTRYGIEFYFYDKMLVAYQIGGMPGLRSELKSVLLQDKMPREIAVAKVFQKKLNNLETPENFLKGISKELKRKIDLFRALRNIAFGLIMVIFLFRLALNLLIKKTDK
jgi:hypothetical protein